MNFDFNIYLLLLGIQIPDSHQTQNSLRILMEGVQSQLKERYRKQMASFSKTLNCFCLCLHLMSVIIVTLNCFREERRAKRQQGRKAKEGREQAG